MTEETTIDWNAPLSGISNDVWREVDVASKYISQPNDTQDFARYTDRLRQALARAITELRNRKPTASKHPEYSPELVERMVALTRKIAGPDAVGECIVEAKTILSELAKSKEVDPLLVEAREIAAKARNRGRIPGGPASDGVALKIAEGKWDDHMLVMSAHAALRRGMELAKDGAA